MLLTCCCWDWFCSGLCHRAYSNYLKIGSGKYERGEGGKEYPSICDLQGKVSISGMTKEARRAMVMCVRMQRGASSLTQQAITGDFTWEVKRV